MAEHKWQQIARAIKRDIEEGKLSPGDRVPSELALAAQWGVSPMTVHRSMHELQRTGWVIRKRRQGTTVAGPEARRLRRIAMMYFSDATILEGAYLRGVQSAIPDEIDLLISVHRDDPKREARLIARLANDVDGIILIGTGAPENDEIIQRTADGGTAVVCLDRVSPGLNVDSVVTDNYGASLEALRWLIARGHRRIAHFTADIMHVSSARDRYDAYLQACRECGIEDPSRWIRSYPVTDTAKSALMAQLVSDAVAALLASPEPPTAIFCLNEYLLGPTLDACDMLGVAVPSELEILSFNDSLHLMWRHEQAVHQLIQRPVEMGRMAVEMLLSRLDDPERPPQAVRFPADFHPAELVTRHRADQQAAPMASSAKTDEASTLQRRAGQ